MGLEAATYVQSLDASNPLAGDPASQGDDHLRLLKSVLLATLPGGTSPIYDNTVEVTVASATSTNVLGAASDKVAISGVATITGLGTGANLVKFVRFTGALTLTHNGTSLILPNAANITTAAGDTMLIVSDASSNVRVLAYQRANGQVISTTFPSATITGAASVGGLLTASAAVIESGVISPTILGASTNDYAPTGQATARVARISSSLDINITGLVAQTSGQKILLDNVGTFNITLTSNDTASSAANRFSLPTPLVLRPGQTTDFRYDGTLSLWVPLAPIVAQSVAGGFKNLKVLCTSNTQVVTTADAITLENLKGEVYRALSVSVTADITTLGAANGLDTGAEASSTWYSKWVIYNPTTNTVASLLSISATAPTMPSGYTFKARVGWVRNDGSSNFLQFIQYGRRIQYIMGTNPNVSVVMASGSSSGVLTAVAVGNFVPSTASEIIFNWHLAQDGIFIAPNSNYSITINATETKPSPIHRTESTSAFAPGGFIGQFVLESTNIYWVPSGNSNQKLFALGWVDNI